jgi:hypothetical protein
VSDMASITHCEVSAEFPVIRAGFMQFTRWIANERRRAFARRVAASVMELQHPGVMADFERASPPAHSAVEKAL